jgi:hypothetical protein
MIFFFDFKMGNFFPRECVRDGFFFFGSFWGGFKHRLWMTLRLVGCWRFKKG